ncbi:hypothetical protein [Hydrogenophaga sp.]|jgi:uncharacterized pyridoxal phosphate-dependent enzyme|uniref:hypothetical protein n=1 Tax=Hydrogenophaga sp. TaxID=1904254 RepID=UPI003F7227D3
MSLDDLHRKYQLTLVLNAAGSFTPLGVSRSSNHVAQSAALAMGSFFIMEELQQRASQRLASWAGCQAGAVTHCAAAAITQAVAACIAGTDQAAVEALPDPGERKHLVVIPQGHCVNYGHPIETDIRMAGGRALQAGDRISLSLSELERCLDEPGVCCLLLVCSRLTSFHDLDLAAAVSAAHARGIPTVIDGAAQDLRVRALLATGADAVLVSAHKHLASPTAGLVLGTQAFVEAFRAQERGIGRAMKASKEAIVGVLAALEERDRLDGTAWKLLQQRKVDLLLDLLQPCQGVQSQAENDPVGMPFQRVRLTIAGGAGAAREIVRRLKAGRPSIWVMEHGLAEGILRLELVGLHESEVRHLAHELTAALDEPSQH